MTSDAHQHFGPPLLGIKSRVRGYTIAQQLDEAAPGTKELLAADAAGSCVVLRIPDNERVASRMKAEANLAQRHLSSTIVQSVGLLEHESWPVQVIEHVDGLRLDTLTLLYGALPAEAACRIGWKIGVALAELHGKKPVMAHGALSAERIIVDAHGLPRLRDLGRIDPEQHEHLMSPERREVLGGPSASDDLFALGLIVAEAALGHRLELGGGYLNPKILAGLMPDRLIDALAALLCPEEQRLSNAAAAVRVLVELEYAIADGEAVLKKAVEKARLGMAFGGLASEEEAVAPMTAPNFESPMNTETASKIELEVPAALSSEASSSADEKAAPFAEEEPTIPSAPPVVSPVEETKTAVKVDAKAKKKSVDTQKIERKVAKASGTAAIDVDAKALAKSAAPDPVSATTTAKKSHAGLIAGLTGAFLVFVAMPASLAFAMLSGLHSLLEATNGNDMPAGLVDNKAFDAKAFDAKAFDSKAFDAKAFDLAAMKASEPEQKPAVDAKMPEMPDVKMPDMPKMPDVKMPEMPSFSVASLEKMLGFGAADAKADEAQLSPDEAKAAAELQAALNAAIAQGALDDKNVKPLEVVPEPLHTTTTTVTHASKPTAREATKPAFAVTTSTKAAPVKKAEKLAEKAEKPVAEKRAKPSALSFDEPTAKMETKAAEAKAEEKPLPKVKLVAGVDGGMRAAAEAAVRACHVANGTVGVIHPGGASTVTTEPRNGCADRALAKALKGFKGSDEPLELDVIE